MSKTVKFTNIALCLLYMLLATECYRLSTSKYLSNSATTVCLILFIVCVIIGVGCLFVDLNTKIAEPTEPDIYDISDMD